MSEIAALTKRGVGIVGKVATSSIGRVWHAYGRPHHHHHRHHHCHGDHPHHDINVTVAIINVGAQRLPNGVELMEAKKREIGRSDKRKKCLDLDHNDHSDQRYHHHHCHYDLA